MASQSHAISWERRLFQRGPIHRVGDQTPDLASHTSFKRVCPQDIARVVMRTVRHVCVSACLIVCPALASYALDEKYEDLSASVEVAPIFSFALDNSNLAFGQLSPNKTAILGEDHFFNQVKCRSNNGRAWYLKAQVLSLRHLDSNYVLPVSSFQWKVVDSTGATEPVGGRSEFHPFTAEPVLIYVGQGKDAQGQPVILKFQYSLTTPPDAPAGTYVGEVVFTMTESP